jgi:hypothetical protein
MISNTFFDKENSEASTRGVRGVKSIGLSSRNQQNTSFESNKNINGKSAPSVQKQLASLPSSQQKQSTQRRAFGDITNKSSLSQAVHELSAKETKQANALTAKTDQQSKAELYALEDRVEELAGKGWEELEAERKRDEQKALVQKVRHVQQALIRSLNDTPSASRLMRDDENEELDFTPEVVQARPRRPCSQSSAAVQREKAAMMWGTVALRGLELPEQDPSSPSFLNSPFIQNCPSLSELLVSSEEEDLLL